ncbi:MAG TPA: cbb3-type cytochrome oxidase assembly protein CcoS [Noviherbaspirillum sp.]|nr:cbb3-type cytochrome oxidase assembly protein CcoS [Noviherbaspirillum sp.]
MEALYLLVPLSVAVVFLAIWIFFRASDSGQFDDLVGPGMRILQDDDRTAPAPAEHPLSGSAAGPARSHERKVEA